MSKYCDEHKLHRSDIKHIKSMLTLLLVSFILAIIGLVFDLTRNYISKEKIAQSLNINASAGEQNAENYKSNP